MRDADVLIVGGGIGGLAAALAVRRAGLSALLFERAPGFEPLGVGINLLPQAVAALRRLGADTARLGDPAAGDGVETAARCYITPEGAEVVREPCGAAAGLGAPQYSIHRARLHAVLREAAEAALGEGRVRLGHDFRAYERVAGGGVRARFRTAGGGDASYAGGALIAADGLHSRARAQMYPGRAPRYTGRTIWRGVTRLPAAMLDGRSMALVGMRDNDESFAVYPMSEAARRGGSCLLNWALGMTHRAPGLGESWSSPAPASDLAPILPSWPLRLGGLTPWEIVQRTPRIIAWAVHDRDPVPSWVDGCVALLGDAAHPMMPFGSQGATQAVLDADRLAADLRRGGAAAAALAAYDAARRPAVDRIVVTNRGGGPTGVLRLARDACGGRPAAEQRRWAADNAATLRRHIAGYRSIAAAAVPAAASHPRL